MSMGEHMLVFRRKKYPTYVVLEALLRCISNIPFACGVSWQCMYKTVGLPCKRIKGSLTLSCRFSR
jgi:hypothetical protein